MDPAQAGTMGVLLGLGLRPAQVGRVREPQGDPGPLTRQGREAEEPAGLGREGWRAPVRAHGRASLEAT